MTGHGERDGDERKSLEQFHIPLRLLLRNTDHAFLRLWINVKIKDFY